MESNVGRVFLSNERIADNGWSTSLRALLVVAQIERSIIFVEVSCAGGAVSARIENWPIYNTFDYWLIPMHGWFEVTG
jgi:hypothetical protein